MKVIELLPKVDTPATERLTSIQISNIIGGNVTPHIVDDIRKKQCWTQYTEGINFYQRTNRLFEEQDIVNLCEYFATNPIGTLTVNDHCRNALRYINFDTSDRYVDTVRKIYNKKYYPKIVSNYTFI